MRILLASALYLFSICPSGAFISKEIISNDGFGCRDVELFKRAVELAHQQDREAFDKLTKPAFSAGICVYLKPKSEVFFEDSNMMGQICLRPKGQVDCYWTDYQVIN